MKRHHLFFILKLLLTSGLLVAVATYVDLQMVWQRIQAVNPLLILAALACVALGYVMCGLRWAWIAQGLGVEVSKCRKVRLYFLGMFASLFLPSTIGGDVVRGILLAKGEGRKGLGVRAAASVILDRANGLYALMLLISLSMLFFSWPMIWWVSWLGPVCALWVAMLIYPWVHRNVIDRLPEKLRKIKELPLTEKVFKKMWWRSLPLSFVFQLMMVQAHVFLGMAVGLEMGWPAYAVMMGLVALVATLPISLNGFGVREAGYVSFAIYFGGDSDAATAMAALWVIVLGLASIPGAWVLWRMGGLKSMQRKARTD
ncbi:MAG: lysylphosphatidylglycerol synthase transmembrane domain-containing protein [Mariprofundaceae bacterium]